MMRVRLSEVDILGLADEVRDDLMGRAEVKVRESAEVIVAAARSNLKRRQGEGPSPAGEPPAYGEGDLHDSIELKKLTRTKNSVRQEYGSDHPSAGLHEFGGSVTQKGKKRLYPPRSYMRPAEDASQAEVERILEEL